MNVFNKMVQNKRGKMLLLAILLTFAIFVKQSASINLTYIVRKEGAKLQHNCIAEEYERYSALGWVYPLSKSEEDAADITTKFVPDIQNEYNCKFSKNDKCNKFWLLRNWQIDENSTRTLDLTFDSRWEDFPTIFTGSDGIREFRDRVEVPSVFRAGFSVRASEGVELLICEGWNPYDHPCYHLNISKTDIFLRKYMSLPKKVLNSDAFLDLYKAFINILTGKEWRNFVVSLDSDGILSLDDVNVNRTVIQYHDKKPLKPLYLLMRSAEPTLWKIHQNHFLYTKTAQISRLGPVLSLPSKTLCISLYASTCADCVMDFFIIKDSSSAERKYLKTVGPTRENEWQMIKLQDNQIQDDKLNIFVETKFVTASRNLTEGFWAVDDVRVCHENEVKVTFLKLKENVSEDEISCQVVRHPQWRPRKLVYSKIEDFPVIHSTANTSSISLNWTQEDPNNEIHYFISYQANDLCESAPYNLRRIKSNGFVRTKHNEIRIENLIPYTKYNVTFTSMVHEKAKKLFVTTLESQKPTPEELPSKLMIRPTDTQAFVSWEKVSCQSVYGHLLYSIQVTNTETNSSKEIQVQTGNTIEINDLEPFTTYTFSITTARNFESIENDSYAFKMDLNFTTTAGMAPPVQNLEVYSADENSVSLRYDLPKRAKGRPALIQVMRCNAISFYKCKPTTMNIARCKLWPKKYCAEVGNLMPGQFYNFKVSIKNDGTNIYGKEVTVKDASRDRVPAPPTNITYKMVGCQHALDYCHLNVSWVHPYNQNGTITAFHIVLNGTDDNVTKDIQEILQIPNKMYLPKYEYQIKYIPYGTHYDLHVQSVNSKFKSNFASIHLKTDDLGQHIDQNPVLSDFNSTSLTFKLPHLDPRLKSYTLTIAVQDFDRTKDLTRDIMKVKKVSNNLCHRFGNTWILPELEISNNTSIEEFTVGTGIGNNKLLQANTQYCIIFVITNKYKKSEHNIVYLRKLKTPVDPRKSSESGSTEAPHSSGSNQSNHLYILLVLLLIIPIGFVGYWYFKKRRPKPKQGENKENVYESLPFEECEENCVNNETYDQLLHK